MDCRHRAPLLGVAAVVAALLSYTETAAADEAPHSAAAATPPSTSTTSQPSAIVRAFRNDAAIHCITFVNAACGWAVGDRGVIWHTNNGGAAWTLQQSPVASSIHGACFVDAHHGWVVGGQCQPHSTATRGLILRTDDGGVVWHELAQPVLPFLNGVKFFDRDHGIAFGQAASYAPSGVFSTRDGGKTWQPLPSEDTGSWLAADFLAPDTGAIAGPGGQLATLMRRKVVLSPLAAPSLRSIRAMCLIAPTNGWAVGDGGLLLNTNDAGRSWQTPPASPLKRAGESPTEQLDLQAVAAQGSHIWIAGTPGSRIFHSPDNGNTWQSSATSQTAPIRSICFTDEQHGWAAGDFGNILATHDGGQTWQSQRLGAQRAALLAIMPSATSVPLEILADSGAANGYISAVDIVCSSAATANQVGIERTREALRLAGAAAANTAWRFPLPAADLALSAEDLIAALNRENDGRAIQQIENHIVRELRTWRPDVVIVEHGTADPNAAGVSAVIEQSVAQAVIAAADPNQHPELSAEVGLSPWQVKKVFGLVHAGTHAEESLETSRFSPWLGMSLADFVAPARNLLFDDHARAPDNYELKLLWSSLPGVTQGRGLFAGISLPPGSEARRPQLEPPTQDIDNLRRLAARRQSLTQLLARTQGNAAWSAQINQMIDGLSDEDAGNLLVQLADEYRKAGRLDLAADTYFLFARRAPDHPLVDPALTWLVQFYSSGEVAHRLETRSATNIRANDGIASNTNNPVQQATAVSPMKSDAPPAISLSRDNRLRRAVQLADYLKTARPALYAESSVRFAEVTAERQLGFTNPSQRFFLTLRPLPESDPWRQCAAAEEWLAKPADTPPAKKLGTCRRTLAPPHLDGKLDEAFWNSADHLFVRDPSSPARINAQAQGQTDTQVSIAHDDEFLYIAVRCPKAANLDYKTSDAPRSRDADLSQHDRVCLRFDIDRDYATAYELTVDHRGWTRDACWGDTTWDPNWYVATADDGDSWIAEAAIPLAELIDKPPAARDVWALAIRRTIPRTGYQTWSAIATRREAASDDSPAQFGLLIFE
jgi:photosystem II stability/assembly factor-like uncharacterized protein